MLLAAMFKRHKLELYSASVQLLILGVATNIRVGGVKVQNVPRSLGYLAMVRKRPQNLKSEQTFMC